VHGERPFIEISEDHLQEDKERHQEAADILSEPEVAPLTLTVPEFEKIAF